MQGLDKAQQQYDRAMPDEVDAEELAEKIHKRALEEMLPCGKCDPLDKDNLQEALSEAGLGFWVKLSDYLAISRFDTGPLIRNESSAYWLKQATYEAEQQIESKAPD